MLSTSAPKSFLFSLHYFMFLFPRDFLYFFLFVFNFLLSIFSQNISSITNISAAEIIRQQIQYLLKLNVTLIPRNVFMRLVLFRAPRNRNLRHRFNHQSRAQRSIIRTQGRSHRSRRCKPSRRWHKRISKALWIKWVGVEGEILEFY